MTDTNLIEIFCTLNNFYKYCTPELKKIHFNYLASGTVTALSHMSDCEIIPPISFHTHYFRDLEPFYLGFICSICVVISCIGFPTTASSRIRYRLCYACCC